MLRQKPTIAFWIRLVFLITMTVLLGEFHSATYAEEGIGAADQTSGLETALTQAGDNRSELEKALQEAQSDEEARAVKFLIANMPEADLQSLSADYLLKNVRFAFRAKHQFPWGRDIPLEIFLNDVVPYASINERRDDWREDFYNRFAPLVKDCKTASEAAQKLNENVFGIVNVKYSTRRKKADQSPYESMEQGLASCTGLSVILTDACRAVGVPARMAGTPLWVNNRGNHTWVEIWDGEWKFTGAAEPDPQGLNRGWFVDIASQADATDPKYGIYATSFQKTDTQFPMVWARRNQTVSGVDVTARYNSLRKKPVAGEGESLVSIDVFDSNGNRIRRFVRLMNDGQEVGNGWTRTDGNDTNDKLDFVMTHGKSLQACIFYSEDADRDACILQHEFQVPAQEHVLVKVNLPAPKAETSDADANSTTSEKTSDASHKLFIEVAKQFFAADAKDQASSVSEAVETAYSKLTASERQQVFPLAWEAFRQSPIRDEYAAEFEQRHVVAGGYTMPFSFEKRGTKPADGWPVVFAMHGGGNAPKRLNDSQWEHMKTRYQADNCLYLALRAPTDEWNGFYTDYVYPLIYRLIAMLSVLEDVDQNRIYAIGYSHGGYGAFSIGPKMADRFAAVHSSAAAPTDGETMAESLMNLRFTFMIGEHDKAYGRLERCQKFDQQIAQLKQTYPECYNVEMLYQEGKQHSNLPDKDHVPTMMKFERNPAPQQVLWRPSDPVIRNFYWLEIAEPTKGMEVFGRIDSNNQIRLTATNVGRVVLTLSDQLIDTGQSLQITVNEETKTISVEPKFATLLRSLQQRQDVHLAYDSAVVVEVESTP